MKIILIALFGMINLTMLHSQNVWTQKSDYGGCERAFGIAFVINDKAYVGGGQNYGGDIECFNSNFEMWEYTPSNDSWIQKSDFPSAVQNIKSFSIGNHGYILVRSNNSGSFVTEVWRYSPVNDEWDQMNDFPGETRISGISFSLSGKGYYGTGDDSAPVKTDFWEYDPAEDQWAQIADIPVGRRGGVAFAIGAKAYVGLGSNAKDFWEYNPISDSWIQKADFEGTARQFSVSFVLGDKAYVGTGFDGMTKKDFWEYDNITDTWQQVDNLPGPVRQSAVAFSINDKGFVTNGYEGSISVVAYKDFWEFSALTSTSEFQSKNTPLKLSIYPIPAKDGVEVLSENHKIRRINIFNSSGQKVLSLGELNENNVKVDLSALNQGLYIIEIIGNEMNERQKIIVN